MPVPAFHGFFKFITSLFTSYNMLALSYIMPDIVNNN